MYEGWSTKLVILRPEPVRPLSSIYQLQGLVTIDGPEKALEFVRLRTAPGNWEMLCGDCLTHEAEVISQRMVQTPPAFGLSMFPIDVPAAGGTEPWGELGVLSNEGFVKGSFDEPRIVTLPDNEGYEIIRWTFTQHYHHPGSHYTGPTMTVQRIRELVGRDGSYQRIELLQKAAPELKNTAWKFPQFG